MPIDPVATTADEAARLAALRRYEILDTPDEAAYDDVAALACSICDTPTALVTLVDEYRQWFKAARGFKQRQTPREIAFCATAIQSDDVLLVSDASQDARFCDNPLVTGEPHIRFYAGAPLVTPDGFRIGTVCVIDYKPRQMSPSQLKALQALSKQVVANMELRRALSEAALARDALANEIEHSKVADEARRQADSFMRSTLDSLIDHIAILDEHGEILYVNDAWSDFANNNCAPEVIARTGKGMNYLDVCDRAAHAGSAEAGTVARALREILAGKTRRQFGMEYPCHAPNRKRWFVVQISAFGDDGNWHAVVSHRNISDRKAADERLHDLNRTLEQRILQRTADLEKAYSSLYASEERLRGLFENASVGIVVGNLGGNLLRVNDAYLKLSGLSRKDLLGRNILDYLHDEDRADFANCLRQLGAGDIPGFDLDVRSGGAAQTAGQWQRLSVSAVHDKDFRINQFVGLVQDLRVSKESELQRNMIFNRSRDMMIVAELEGRIRTLNKACSHILGYSAEEFAKLNFLDLVHEEDLGRAREGISALGKGAAVMPLDVRMRTRAGEYRDIVWNSVPWTEAGVFLGVGRDLTSMRAAQRTLNAQATMLQRAEQMAQIGSWQYEFGRDVVYCSAGLRAIVDWHGDSAKIDLEALLGCMSEDYRAELRQSVAAVAADGAPRRIQCLIQRPDGTLRTIQTSIDVLRDSKAKIVGVIGACLDITDMNQTIEQLTASEQQLRALGRKLEQIREEERANISREIHDELGQVLTALKIDLTLLSRDIANPADSPPVADEIVSALSSMQDLVDATIRSVRTIATQLRPEVLDAFGLVTAIRWHANEFQRRTEIECEVNASEEHIALSPEARIALFRITQEAMTNVARHALAKRIEIGISQGDDIVELSIRDNGRGVDLAELISSNSLGVMGMRERAAMIDGTFDIRAAANGGTLIRVRAPLTDVGAAPAGTPA
ncbi:MAG: PAS domain S-box protein [Woeseia sp.]